MRSVATRLRTHPLPRGGTDPIQQSFLSFKAKLIVLLVAGTLLLSGSPVYSVPGIFAAQKERSAHPKKPLKFLYVCPMHEDITSQKRGTCPKCKMKLVKKPVPQEPAQ